MPAPTDPHRPPPDPRPAAFDPHRPPPDPAWPGAATSEGQALRLAAGLSNPGNPRRALRMLLVLVAFVAVCAAVAIAVA